MASKKDPPWWLSGATPVTPANGFTRVFRQPPADAERPGRRRRFVDQGQTLSQRLNEVPIGLSHLYGILGKASQQLTIARETARTLLAHLAAELLDTTPVDGHNDAALLSALAELADAEPKSRRRARTYLDHAYTAGLPMADAAEFVQIVDADLRVVGVALKDLVPKTSALALVLGMVRT